MPEHPEAGTRRLAAPGRQALSRRLLVPLLVLAVAALVWVALNALSLRTVGESAGGGTDAQATAALAESGVSPWFVPMLRPSGPEAESGLFALQAAVGAGVLGYVLGRLHERRRTSGAIPDGGPDTGGGR